MSRSTQSKRSGDEDEICPVCKTSRYLNPQMTFKVNPECYHKMCSSCIDRIFSSGPAPCPIAGCRRTLRKARFRAQTFGDIAVEKEVDQRRWLSTIFNRREQEFESLRAWNDYLEDVEDFTFRLLNGIDTEATVQQIKEYQKAHSSEIERNNDRDSRDQRNAEQRQQAARDAQRYRREAARQVDASEKQERDSLRLGLIDQLATASKGDVKKLVSENQKLRSSAAAARIVKDEPDGEVDKTAAKSYTIRGLKATDSIKEEVFDPFDGALPANQYFKLQESYSHPWLEEAQTNVRITGGGYDVHEYYARAMFEAFAGLGVFVEDEIAAREDKDVKKEDTEASNT